MGTRLQLADCACGHVRLQCRTSRPIATANFAADRRHRYRRPALSPGRKATLEPASEDLAIQQWERLTALAAGKPATRLVTLRAKARVCRNAVMRGHAGCDKATCYSLALNHDLAPESV